MVKLRDIGRRSFLARVAGGAIAIGVGLILGSGEAEAKRRRRRATPTPRRMLVDADPRDPARPIRQPPANPPARQPPPILAPPQFPTVDNPPPADPVGRPARVSRFVVCPGNRRCPRRLR